MIIMDQQFQELECLSDLFSVKVDLQGQNLECTEI